MCSVSTFVLAILVVAAPLCAQEPPAPAARTEAANGEFSSYYGNGVLRERGPVDATGARIGEWRQFWPNGRTFAVGSYEKGAPRGAWSLRDMYGREVEVRSHAPGSSLHGDRPARLLPLRVDDLRAGLVGMRTVGELVDRYAAAGDDETGAEVRRAVMQELANAPPEASGVPFVLAAAATGAQRARWLELMAVMPMPDRIPSDELLAWRDDPACAEVAHAILQAHLEYYAKCYATLRDTAMGTSREHVGDRLLRFSSKARQAGIEPWLAMLDSRDAVDRVAGMQALATFAGGSHRPTVQPPLDAVLRALDDPCAAVRDGAVGLISAIAWCDPAALDAALPTMVQSAQAPVRVLAAARLVALGRSGEAATLLDLVADTEPDALDYGSGWSLLLKVTKNPDAARDLLYAHRQDGILQREPIVDPRVVDRCIERGAENGWHLDAGASPAFRSAVSERVAAMLDAQDVPVATRRKGISFLLSHAPDAERARIWMDRAFADPDAGVRSLGLMLARDAGAAPTAAQWRALLDDTESRAEALQQLSRYPLPPDFDPLPYPVPGNVLATWADGDPERVRIVVDGFLHNGGWLMDALELLKPDPAFVAERRRVAPKDWQVPIVDLDRLHRFLPDLAAERWVRNQLQPPGPACPAGPRALPPMTDAMVAALRRLLLESAGSRRDSLFDMLAAFGAAGRPLLPTVEELLGEIHGAERMWAITAVCAIAPDQAMRVCQGLLARGGEEVDVVLLGPAANASNRWEQKPIRVLCREEFAREVVAHLASTPYATTRWFEVFEGGEQVLPELREAFRKDPTNWAIQSAIAGLGIAAAKARPDLLAALPTTASVLERVGVDDPGSLGTLEHLVRDAAGDVATAARRLLMTSASTSAFADAVRRAFLADPGAAIPDRLLPHCLRLWPDLTAAERARVLCALRAHVLGPQGQRLDVPPKAEILDALAAQVSTEAADVPAALSALVRLAPLHPTALACVEASARFWNPQQDQGAPWPVEELAQSLVWHWHGSDAAFRARATPWLQLHADAVRRAYSTGFDAALSDLDRFDLQVRSGSYMGWSAMTSPDREVRRAGLCAYVVMAPASTWLARRLNALTRAGTFEERFGPLEGLPAVCQDLARVPPVEQRVQQLRAMLVGNDRDVAFALCADPVAARALLPEIRQAFGSGAPPLAVLRRIGPDAKELLPDVEALLPIPVLHFAARDTARVLRGELPPDPPPSPFPSSSPVSASVYR